MKTPRYTKDQIATALTRTKGMITLAAQSLGCDPTTVRNYITRYPDLQTVLSDERERMSDVTELKLYEAIQNREGWAITLYLKTQGKSRGYVERQEITGADSGPIMIEAIDYRQAIAALAPPAAPALAAPAA